jgi:hypothetical protein
MKMSKIFIDWAVKRCPNDKELGKLFRRFYHLAAAGDNTEEACRLAEETIMQEAIGFQG